MLSSSSSTLEYRGCCHSRKVTIIWASSRRTPSQYSDCSSSENSPLVGVKGSPHCTYSVAGLVSAVLVLLRSLLTFRKGSCVESEATTSMVPKALTGRDSPGQCPPWDDVDVSPKYATDVKRDDLCKKALVSQPYRVAELDLDLEWPTSPSLTTVHDWSPRTCVGFYHCAHYLCLKYNEALSQAQGYATFSDDKLSRRYKCSQLGVCLCQQRASRVCVNRGACTCLG